MILFLHGLNGQNKVNDGSHEKLELTRKKFKKVIAPSFDYNLFFKNDLSVLNYLEKYIVNKFKIDAVIGNSFGGLLAFKLNEYLDCPKMLINPPLGKYNFDWEYKENKINNNIIFLSKNDKIINPIETVNFLNNITSYKFTNQKNNELFHLDDEHRISNENFNNGIEYFKNKFNI